MCIYIYIYILSRLSHHACTETSADDAQSFWICPKSLEISTLISMNAATS